MLGDILLKIGAVAFMVFFFGFCILFMSWGIFWQQNGAGCM